MQILLVEDDFGIRDMLTLLLEEEGHRVQTAIHGQAALEVLAASPSLPAIILLDLAMPVMDAWAFRAVQKQDARLAHIPVVVLSADRGVGQKASEITADAYIAKPVSLTELLPILERFALSSA